MKRSLIASRKVLKESGYSIRDFLPEEVLDILHAANAEKLSENVESCWPAQGGVYLKLDEKSKPKFVANIKDFRNLMTHTIALRASNTIRVTKNETDAHTGGTNMETDDPVAATTPGDPVQPLQPPVTPSHNTQGVENPAPKTSTPTVTAHTNTTSAAPIQQYPNLPKTNNTPSKGEVNRRNYAALWGSATPLRHYNKSVRSEILKSNLSLNDVGFGFADTEDLNGSNYVFSGNILSPSPGGSAQPSKSAATKFTSPPKMHFSALKVKPVKSPLASKQPAASPGSATNATKVPSTEPIAANSGTTGTSEKAARAQCKT